MNTETRTRHVTVYREAGRFAGWPANHGVWHWGQEIVVGFQSGFLKMMGPTRHAIDKERPRRNHLARSTDGGDHWSVSAPPALNVPTAFPNYRPEGSMTAGSSPGAATASAAEASGGSPQKTQRVPIDFSNPSFALACLNKKDEPGACSLLWSYDRCRSWSSPATVKVFDERLIEPRTDYIVHGPAHCTLFLTAMKDDGKEGRPFCVETTDGGRSWDFVGWIGPEPRGMTIMPSSLLRADGRMITAVRCQETTTQAPPAAAPADGQMPKDSWWWMELYQSADGGRSWELVGTPVPRRPGLSNPPALVPLADGRLSLTYGSRSEPLGIYARLSTDEGKTWSPEICLREGGGNWDLGYVRTVAVAPHRVVTIYYYNDDAASERYIAATIWDPAAV